MHFLFCFFSVLTSIVINFFHENVGSYATQLFCILISKDLGVSYFITLLLGTKEYYYYLDIFLIQFTVS